MVYQIKKSTWTPNFDLETAFKYAKFNSERDRALPFLFQKKDRITELYPDISKLIIHRKMLRQCGGDLHNSVKSRTNEKYSGEDIIYIPEVITRTEIGCSGMKLKARFATPLEDSVDKKPKENLIHKRNKSA
ncbi:hypothetical protein O181_002511 [Austropuccinia psidii MF-1]|uniref:Uncharacterized protein n=1 Tax=Austropuccinia psidii MF-1 TaxID=1389203 RepID=A0A9Q3BC23_9BASI|nr:hypothetical protein [Austropuccinia psidii MF-1]